MIINKQMIFSAAYPLNLYKIRAVNNTLFSKSLKTRIH